jgi:hypothetical protein
VLITKLQYRLKNERRAAQKAIEDCETEIHDSVQPAPPRFEIENLARPFPSCQVAHGERPRGEELPARAGYPKGCELQHIVSNFQCSAFVFVIA